MVQPTVNDELEPMEDGACAATSTPPESTGPDQSRARLSDERTRTLMLSSEKGETWKTVGME